MLKYVALINVNNTIYSYYGRDQYEFGVAGELPTIQILDNQVQEYNVPHTVEIIPIYRLEDFPPFDNYTHIMFKHPPRLLPHTIREYLPIIHMILRDENHNIHYIMEKLHPFVYSKGREKSCLDFLQMGVIHGNIQMSSLMLDDSGKVKILGFQHENGKCSNDRKNMAKVLLQYKHKINIRRVHYDKLLELYNDDKELIEMTM